MIGRRTRGGRLRGDGSGPDLLLYAPIDTVTTGDPAEDLPWVGNELRADLTPHAQFDENYVIGLGASNPPKGHAVCIVAAAEAIAAAGIPLRGDLVLGFGAGGMPTNARPRCRKPPRRNTGQGVGCSFLLEQGVWADCALIAKPGWTVSWEEVGLAWFEITVHGLHTYVGSRHRLPYRNAITAAGEVVAKLEEWFPKYSAAHQTVWLRLRGSLPTSAAGGSEQRRSPPPSRCALPLIYGSARGRRPPRPSANSKPSLRRSHNRWICRSTSNRFLPSPGEFRPSNVVAPRRSPRVGSCRRRAASGLLRREWSHRRKHPAQPRHPDDSGGYAQGGRRTVRGGLRDGG